MRIAYLGPLLAAAMLVSLVSACDNDSVVTTTPPATATGTATTVPLTDTAGPAGSATPPAGRVDGTVAPEGFGGTAPVMIKANPDPPSTQALLTDVRIGAHPEEGGWDRIVFEFRDILPAGTVAYVPDVSGCASGAPIAVAGKAVLLVRFNGADAHTSAGQPSVRQMRLPGPGGAIVEARQVCDFEGEVTWAVGTTGVQRFKVTLVDGPRRVVIDVKR